MHGLRADFDSRIGEELTVRVFGAQLLSRDIDISDLLSRALAAVLTHEASAIDVACAAVGVLAQFLAGHSGQGDQSFRRMATIHCVARLYRPILPRRQTNNVFCSKAVSSKELTVDAQGICAKTQLER